MRRNRRKKIKPETCGSTEEILKCDVARGNVKVPETSGEELIYFTKLNPQEY